MGRRGRRGGRARRRPPARKPGGGARSTSRRPGTRGDGKGKPTAAQPAKPGLPPLPKVIELPETMTVRDLARALRMNPIDIIKELMANGIVVSINQTIDYDTAEIVASELGFDTQPIRVETAEEVTPRGLPRRY